MTLEAILRSIKRIPAFPMTVQRVFELLRDENYSVQEVTEVIRYDQAVTANVLRICNSSYFGVRQPIKSLKEAVVYLGKENLIRAVQTSGVSRYYRKGGQGYVAKAGDLWRHSVAVAVMSQILVRRMGRPEDSVLYTAALLHDIGKVILGEYVQDSFDRILALVTKEGRSFLEAEAEVLGVNHAEIGGKVAGHWNFPAEIGTAITFHHRPDAVEGEAQFPWLVHLADEICLMMGVGGGNDGLAYRAVTEVAQRFNLRQRDIEVAMVELFEELRRAEELLAIVP